MGVANSGSILCSTTPGSLHNKNGRRLFTAKLSLSFFQFDLPFVEVHRVKAVRFSLPPCQDRGGYEEIAGVSGGTDEESYPESLSRNGSQQYLADRSTALDTTNEEKSVSPLLCCVCCRKAPVKSVWNCDGEILPCSDVFCR